MIEGWQYLAACILFILISMYVSQDDKPKDPMKNKYPRPVEIVGTSVWYRDLGTLLAVVKFKDGTHRVAQVDSFEEGEYLAHRAKARNPNIVEAYAVQRKDTFPNPSAGTFKENERRLAWNQVDAPSRT